MMENNLLCITKCYTSASKAIYNGSNSNTRECQKVDCIQAKCRSGRRLKVLAKKDNRSLNNYVENVLMSVAYNEPNETTKAALKEAEESKNLEEFDLDAFKKYVASLQYVEICSDNPIQERLQETRE